MKSRYLIRSLLAGSALLLTLLTATTPVVAKAPMKSAPSEAAPPPVVVPYERFKLANGLTVIVVEDHRTPVVSVQRWHHVGSANEVKGRTGFAHLFEHLMFNGSEHSDTDWFKPMNEVGASSMNGTTSFDRTNYYQTVPKAGLDRTLWLEADRMAHLLPAVDQAKLDEQRGVVQNEKRQRANTPGGDIPERIARMTYPDGHPYSWTPIGSMDDLNAASLDDVRSFFNQWYGAANTVLVLAGDITPAEARAKAEHYFGELPSGPPVSRSVSWTAKMVGDKRDRVELRTANAELMKVWNIPGWDSKDSRLLGLAAELLQNSDGRLSRRLLREEELATDVSVSATLNAIGSQFVIDVTARPGVSLDRIERVVDEELRDFMANGPSQELLDRVKFRRYANMVKGIEAVEARGQMLAQAELYGGSPDFYVTTQKWTSEATPRSIADAAKRWLADGVYVLEALPQPDYAPSASDIHTEPLPPMGKPEPFHLPPLKEATLSNGLKVRLAEYHDNPMVSLSLVFDFGSNPSQNPDTAGIGVVTGTQMLNGTSKSTALDISRMLQANGASLVWQGGYERSKLMMGALKARLQPSLAILADVLLHPSFPEDEWKRDRDNGVAQRRDLSKTTNGKASRIAPMLEFGPDHPYAQSVTPELLMRYTTADFRAFHDRWMRPDLATLYVVGDTTLDEIVPELERALGGWRVDGTSAPDKPGLPAVVPNARPRVFLVDQPGAESTLIQLIQSGTPRAAADYDVKNLVSGLLGGDFLSRLNMNLREDKHWSYGAKASLTPEGNFAAGAMVQFDKTADAMREIDREMREIASSRPPSEAEVQMAKNAMLLGLPAELGTNGKIMNLYQEASQYQLGDDYWNRYVPTISAITTDQAGAAAAELVKPGEWSWLIIGDLSKIESSVRKLGFGDVEVLDAEGKRIR